MSSNPAELATALEQFVMRLMTVAEADGLDALAELDVPFSQARLLFMLAHSSEPLPIHAIARRLNLSVAATGRNVDALVRLELLERREDPDDRRVKLVSITASGSQITSAHFETKRASMRAFADRLPAAQRNALHNCLADILAGPYLSPATDQEPLA